MDKDRRTDNQVLTDELRQELNPQQRMTLGELELLGWSLKFVRRPMFQDPVPIVLSNTNDEIGRLDPDGKIIIEKNSGIRADNNQSSTEPEPEHETAPQPNNPAETEVISETVVVASWAEKRKGESAIPDRLEDYLNDEQLRALRQIENFGWQLKFVRRPMFQHPVAVIINTDGDRLGTLEADGRIDLQSDFSLRGEPVEPSNGEIADPVTGKKQLS